MYEYKENIENNVQFAHMQARGEWVSSFFIAHQHKLHIKCLTMMQIKQLRKLMVSSVDLGRINRPTVAGYSILGFYPVEVMHSFKFIRSWNGFS